MGCLISGLASGEIALTGDPENGETQQMKRDFRSLLLCSVVSGLTTCPSATFAQPATPAMRMLTTSTGTRFGLFGAKPKRPSPTFFVFATSIEDMTKFPIFTTSGRQLAKQGWLYVTLDPPCHGRDHKPNEPSALSGWAHRVKTGQDPVKPFTDRCRDVLDWLVSNRYTAPNQVAAGGTSRGGFCALHLAAAEPRVRTVVCVSPVTELRALREFREVTAEQARPYDASSLATRLVGRHVWISIGNSDQRVSTDSCVSTVRNFVRAAVKASPNHPVPIELVIGPSQGHSAIDNAYGLAADFVLKHSRLAGTKRP